MKAGGKNANSGGVVRGHKMTLGTKEGWIKRGLSPKKVHAERTRVKQSVKS